MCLQYQIGKWCGVCFLFAALIEAIVRNESDHMRNILESELIDVNG